MTFGKLTKAQQTMLLDIEDGSMRNFPWGSRGKAKTFLNLESKGLVCVEKSVGVGVTPVSITPKGFSVMFPDE